MEWRMLLPGNPPARLLVIVTLINMLAFGSFLNVGVLYFSRILRHSAAEVGLGLTIAGAAGLMSAIPVGHLADKRGSRGVYAVLLLLGGVALAGLVVARDFWTFVFFVSLASAAQVSGFAARGPLVLKFGGDRPVEFRNLLRAVSNLGFAMGSLLAGWALFVDTSTSYLSLIAFGASLYVAASILVMLMPMVLPQPASAGPRWVALRNRPYVVLTVLDGLMSMQFQVLTTAVPLWLVHNGTAPNWTVAAILLMNTIIVVFFQVRASRGVDSARSGAIAFRRAGLFFFGACIVFSLTAGVNAWIALGLSLGAVVIHTIGEVLHSAGGFELSFALAEPHAVGQYQGLFRIGLGLGGIVGPVFLIGLVVDWGAPGWWVVGAFFATIGAAMPVVVRWAERCTPAT